MNPKPISWVKDGECMICTSHVSGNTGYPRIYRNGVYRTIARRILFKRHGEQAPEIVSRHTCDRRDCINPDHIIIGTVKDNTRDAITHGRFARNGIFHYSGKTKPWAKLNEAQVLEIRALLKTTPPRIIRKQFGINRNSLWKIANGRSWKHLLPAQA